MPQEGCGTRMASQFRGADGARFLTRQVGASYICVVKLGDANVDRPGGRAFRNSTSLRVLVPAHSRTCEWPLSVLISSSISSGRADW